MTYFSKSIEWDDSQENNSSKCAVFFPINNENVSLETIVIAESFPPENLRGKTTIYRVVDGLIVVCKCLRACQPKNLRLLLFLVLYFI